MWVYINHYANQTACQITISSTLICIKYDIGCQGYCETLAEYYVVYYTDHPVI